jgi:uncharacterized membrane protein YfcA
MEYVAVCAAALLVAGLTFFSGFGLGTLLMPVFAVFFPVEIAIAATAIVHLANNLFKVALAGRYARARVVLAFAVPGALAAVPGALLLGYVSTLSPWAAYTIGGREFVVLPVKVVIAALIVVFATIEVLPATRKLSFDLRWIPLGGILSGFFGGLSGHQGALRTAFLLRLGLPKKELIGTMVVSSAVVDVTRLAIYGLTFFGKDFAVLRDGGGIGLVVAGCIAAFAGSFAGSRLLEKITLQGLQRLIAGMLFVLALALGLGLA